MCLFNRFRRRAKSTKRCRLFKKLELLAGKHGPQRIYDDYVSLYLITSNKVDDVVFTEISEIASLYNEDSLEIEKTFSILYMAMIAEEQKVYTKLGKRIKRLGVHMLLCEDASPDYAANFMKGMRWQEIDALCEERHF